MKQWRCHWSVSDLAIWGIWSSFRKNPTLRAEIWEQQFCDSNWSTGHLRCNGLSEYSQTSSFESIESGAKLHVSRIVWGKALQNVKVKWRMNGLEIRTCSWIKETPQQWLYAHGKNVYQRRVDSCVQGELMVEICLVWAPEKMENLKQQAKYNPTIGRRVVLEKVVSDHW